MVTIANLQKRQRPPPEPCSNRGTCDLTQGICICQFGFTGYACQIVDLCPSESDPYPCNGHGKCQSARQQFVDAGKTDAMYEATWAAMADSHDDWLRYRYGESWYACKLLPTLAFLMCYCLLLFRLLTTSACFWRAVHSSAEQALVRVRGGLWRLGLCGASVPIRRLPEWPWCA